MEPTIRTTEIKLVGVQGILPTGDFVPQLKTLYQRLFDRIADIPGISPANRTVGYWQFVDQETHVHFAGVQVDTFDHFKWDYAYGLASWSLGNTTWAIWPEPDGQEGSITHGGVCWRWLDAAPYVFDNRFIGDFEVYYWQKGQIGQQTRSSVHEIWIPVTGKEAEQ